MKAVALASVGFVAVEGTPNYQQLWTNFKEKYGKAYSNGDEDSRFGVFKKNVDIIAESNSKGLSYTLGINEFADLSNEEFVSTYMGYSAPTERYQGAAYLGRHEYNGEALADSVDWVAQGAVTPVKNQAQCGSCWSFSTTGALEGAFQIASGNLVSLSEQQYVDCDHVDSGCNGGLMDNAFKFAEQNGICTEDSYAYKGKKGSCQASSCTIGLPKGSVTGFKDVAEDDASAMMSALMKGPVSIAIEADKSAFQLYTGGILDSTACGTQLDHGVLLVGAGTDGGKDYWKIKNSWGATWGEEGYIRFKRGVGSSGECGLLKQASYPVVNGDAPPAPPSPPSPPSPPPAPPSGDHYEAPPCADDETALSLAGKGSYCGPSCDGGCPAPGKCAVRDQSGNQYCGIECNILDSCPSGMTCSDFLSGICLWPEMEGGVAATNTDKGLPPAIVKLICDYAKTVDPASIATKVCDAVPVKFDSCETIIKEAIEAGITAECTSATAIVV